MALINEGDEVLPSCIGNLGQSFARIHIVADSREHLFTIINLVQDTLQVKDEYGNNMKLSGLNTSAL